MNVPSIPRGLESYESSEHPTHPWVLARTCTRSCKRWSGKFDFTSDPPSTQTFSTFQHVREIAVGCKETVARACQVPLGLCGGRAGRCADLRQSGRLASCLLRPASSNCISPRRWHVGLSRAVQFCNAFYSSYISWCIFSPRKKGAYCFSMACDVRESLVRGSPWCRCAMWCFMILRGASMVPERDMRYKDL